MIFSQKRFINGVFLFAFLILIGSGYYIYLQFQRLLATNEIIIHTHETIQTTSSLLLPLTDAESRTSFYLISNNKNAIKELSSLIQSAEASINTLQQLTIDNPAQQERIKQLKSIVAEKIKLGKKIIALFDEGKKKEALNLAFGEERLYLKEEVAKSINKIIKEEFNLLEKRNSELHKEVKENNLILFYIGVITLIIFLFNLFLLNYYLQKQEKIQNKIKKADELLNEYNKKLIESEERLTLSTESSGVGLWDWIPGTENVFYSKKFKEMLGYSEEELPNTLQSFENAIHPEDHDALWARVNQHLQEKKPFVAQYRLRLKNGEYRWFQAAGKAQWDEHNNPFRMSGSIIDITERKKIEKMKNEFVSVVSHELRTPLTSIRGSLGLMMGGTVGDFSEKAKSLLDIANNNCERLLLLINDILDIEKIEAGKMKFNLKSVDLHELVKNAIHTNQLFGEKYGVHLIFHPSPDSPIKVEADPDRLMQVLTNLISNAIKFSNKEGTVSLSITQNKKTARVTVNDQGSGIPPEFQSQIFKKFSQADTSDTRGKGGTGLGLSISKAIIEKMNGTLSFNSIPHVETHFWFELPIAEETTLSIDKEKDEPNLKPLLICEDDEDQATYLSELLKSAGFSVDIALTVSQAKELLHQKNYIALLLDLILPDQDGIAFIRELRALEKTRDLPIIVLSVIANTGKSLLNGDAFSVIDWLEKPIDFNKLTHAISLIKKKTYPQLPRILHVEDDTDTQLALSALLDSHAAIVSKNSLHSARDALLNEKFDLVILDLLLPDGNGTELIPILAEKKIPVIVFSVTELDSQHSKYVTSSLIKSQTSNEKLLQTIQKIIKSNA